MHEFFDNQFQKSVVFLHPGDYYCTEEDVILQTVLGSCISVCLYSDYHQYAGMNHFMLPHKTDISHFEQTESGRYGIHAMDLLIGSLIKNGIKKNAIKAKVFGGGNVIVYNRSYDGIASNNIKFIINYLDKEQIPMISSHLGGSKARKILFFPKTKKVLLKEISGKEQSRAIQEEIKYQTKIIEKEKQEKGKKSSIIFFD